MMLSARNLVKRIGDRSVLEDVSIEIKRGQITSIIGPSGAGKTTLLRALALVDLADSGRIVVDDEEYQFPLASSDHRRPYPRLTVVFQQLFIWPHLTIRENLALPLEGRFDRGHFDQLVGLFNMDGFLDRYPNEVSIGQRQRAALVRALLLRPTYLLLDEVTSALDIEQSHLILGHLRDVAEMGVGILWVSHAVHLAAAISDHLVFVDQGRVLESGGPELLDAPQSGRLIEFMSSEVGIRRMRGLSDSGR